MKGLILFAFLMTLSHVLGLIAAVQAATNKGICAAVFGLAISAAVGFVAAGRAIERGEI